MSEYRFNRSQEGAEKCGAQALHEGDFIIGWQSFAMIKRVKVGISISE